MKMTQKMVLIAGLFCSTLLPQSLALIPQKTNLPLIQIDGPDVLLGDLDNVVLNLPKAQWPVIAYRSIKLIENRQDMVDLPKTLYYMYQGFTKKVNGVKGIRDAHGNKVDGLTAQMLTLGQQHPESARFIAPLLDIIESSRKLDTKVLEIIKSTGLPIVWTTNKDSLTYQQAARLHGLATIARAAIVTKYPLSREVLEFAQLPGTPKSYCKLVEKYHNDKETSTIFHAPTEKPNSEYFKYVEKVIGADKNTYFIDDKLKNVNGCTTALPSTNTVKHVGVHFKNAEQLINDLVMLGICH